MRLCRFQRGENVEVGFYHDTCVVPLKQAQAANDNQRSLPDSDNLLDFLPPSAAHAEASALAGWVASELNGLTDDLKLPLDQIQLLVPNPKPNKLFLLAGNYAKHIEEGGGIAAERAETFPYVFMKPPTTTLTNPGDPIRIPKVSPNHIDWELELCVVIGKEAKGVSEADALDYVAGYTVVNDISNRKFKPNDSRKDREKDGFFDWLHGKWHDSFCPCGPCIASADSIPDPQTLALKLSLNGEVRQDSSTANQIFPVAAVIEFISSFVTLEPGDMISTGTPDGVGNTTGTYLKAGDTVEASIAGIGTVRSPVIDGDD